MTGSRETFASDAAPRAIGYQVAAGMIGGAVLPAGIGLVMQQGGVSALGACLSVLALTLGGLHLAVRRTDEHASPITPAASATEKTSLRARRCRAREITPANASKPTTPVFTRSHQ